jgi:hypothetical protein
VQIYCAENQYNKIIYSNLLKINLVVSKCSVSLHHQINEIMANEIKIGDFIKGQYQYGCVSGIVVKVKKMVVVIKRCTERYNEYTITDNMVNVTKRRIYEIGLQKNETIK